MDSFQNNILKWYQKNARELPWREENNLAIDPYKIWVSEVMLQQTTVAAVKDYYQKFIKKWPTVKDLANASQDEVLALWSGLGYYTRARNLHQCAQVINKEYQGKFPSDILLLKKLPGIGDYTAAAIKSIAFDQPAVVIDGNIERVAARVFMVEDPLPKGKKRIKEAAAQLFDGLKKSHGDYAQALMDLGASVCTPRSPSCNLCPVSKICLAYQKGQPEAYPVRAAKKDKPIRYATAFFIQDKDGRFFLQKRKEEGMLAGLYEIPTSDWVSDKQQGLEVPKNGSPTTFLIKWFNKEAYVYHSFTHFDFEVRILSGVAIHERSLLGGEWVRYNDMDRFGIPSVMKKIINQGRKLAQTS